MFWIGFFILLASHVQLFIGNIQAVSRQHSAVALTGLVLMFVGSKIGREFLGIK